MLVTWVPVADASLNFIYGCVIKYFVLPIKCVIVVSCVADTVNSERNCRICFLRDVHTFVAYLGFFINVIAYVYFNTHR